MFVGTRRFLHRCRKHLKVSFLETSGGTGCAAASMAEHKWSLVPWLGRCCHGLMFAKAMFSAGQVFHVIMLFSASCGFSQIRFFFESRQSRRDCVLADGCQELSF